MLMLTLMRHLFTLYLLWPDNVLPVSCVKECLTLPSVCDLFSCMSESGGKDKWLHRAAEQVNAASTNSNILNYSEKISHI